MGDAIKMKVRHKLNKNGFLNSIDSLNENFPLGLQCCLQEPKTSSKTPNTRPSCYCLAKVTQEIPKHNRLSLLALDVSP